MSNPPLVTEAQCQTSEGITLLIPCLPDLNLSANRRRVRHFMQQAKDTKAERLSAALTLQEAGRNYGDTFFGDLLAMDHPLALHWNLYWAKGTRARDADGCADLLKSWIDAMRDLGWIPNDSPRYMRTVSYTSMVSSALGPSMKLRIERVWE